MDEIGGTKTQAPDVRGMNEMQMGKSIGHLTKSRFWMVQMAAAAPEHVLIRVQGVFRCRRRSAATAASLPHR